MSGTLLSNMKQTVFALQKRFVSQYEYVKTVVSYLQNLLRIQ